MNAKGLPVAAAARPLPIGAQLLQLAEVFKLRIGLSIAVTALAGAAIASGPPIAPVQVVLLFVTVLVASACAGAFNQYLEVDLDARMQRTRGRPFVTGRYRRGAHWPLALLALFTVAIAANAWFLNPWSAFFTFLGSFFYVVVYTLWLKPRTPLNIVIGGAAGSFAVLAGAAAVDPQLSPLVWVFALVLFLWTPSHFWSLAIALHEDYARAGVPMLPVVIGKCMTARVVTSNTVLLVAVSLWPLQLGLGPVYAACAIAGGGCFLHRNVQMLRRPDVATGRASFRASLVQLGLLLAGAVLDVSLRV